MSGAYTRNKTNPNCKPKITNTKNQQWWEQKAAERKWFVKQDGATSTADEIGVDILTTDDTIAMGRVIGTTGDGDDFRVSVECVGIRGKAAGAETDSAALAAGDYGDFCKANANGELVIDDAVTTGNIIVVGGNKTDLMVAWQFPYNK